MMKKTKWIGALALICTLIFAGCGKKEEKPETSPSPTPTVTSSASPESNEESTPGTTPETEQTAKPTTKPTVKPTNKPTAKPTGNTAETPVQPEPTKEPAPTSIPTPEPTPKPTAKPAVPVSSVIAAMAGAMEAPMGFGEMPREIYKDVYGIDPAQFEEVSVYGSQVNVKASELIVIRAKDSAGAANAKKLLNQRKEVLLEQWKHYLPDQYEIVQKSVIQTSGNYVALIVCDEVDSVSKAFTNAVKG